MAGRHCKICTSRRRSEYESELAAAASGTEKERALTAKAIAARAGIDERSVRRHRDDHMKGLATAAVAVVVSEPTIAEALTGDARRDAFGRISRQLERIDAVLLEPGGHPMIEVEYRKLLNSTSREFRAWLADIDKSDREREQRRQAKMAEAFATPAFTAFWDGLLAILAAHPTVLEEVRRIFPKSEDPG